MHLGWWMAMHQPVVDRWICPLVSGTQAHFTAHGLRLNGNRLMNNNRRLNINKIEDE